MIQYMFVRKESMMMASIYKCQMVNTFDLLNRKGQTCLASEGLLSGLSGWNLSWILAVVFQWLRTNARTAVWSNMLV